MMESSEKQDQIVCGDADLLLEKTILEERLSETEQNAVRVHMEQCERCRNAYQLTNALPLFAEAAAEGEFDADISVVLDSLRRERQVETRYKSQRWALGIVAGLAALLLFGIWSMRQPEEENLPAAMTASFECNASSTVELVSGVLMTFCEGNEPGTIIEDGAVRVSLRQGTVALSVNPERPLKKSVSVKTPGGEVRVKGTLFAVHVIKSDERVEVFRGIVEVIPDRADLQTYEVTAGHGSRIPSHETYALVNPVSEKLMAALLAQADGDEGEEIVDDTDSASVDSRRVASADAVADGEDTDSSGVSKNGGGNMNRHAPKSMEGLIEDARSCLLVRDWKCAASRYQKVLNVYSRHPESTAVLISLAKIELRHLNSPRQALSHYNTYLQKAPNGPLAEEALLGTAKSYRNMGRLDDEKKALRRFIARFPNSSLSGKAKIRLGELEAKNTI